MSDNPERVAMNYLSEDVAIHILSLCPVKSLMRFRCVCKLWRSLISDPKFIQLHFTHSNTSIDRQHFLSSPYLIASRACLIGSPANPLLSPTQAPTFIVLLGTCNGLVCVSMNYEELIVFNPSTKQYKELPLPPEINLRYRDSYWGFGFDSSVGDYKLVLCLEVGFMSNKIMVLSFKDNFWRTTHQFDAGDFINFGYSPSHAILLDGFLHWRIGLSRKSILSFDLSKEVFQEVPEPNPSPKGPFGDEFSVGNNHIGVIEGCLWVTRVDWNGVGNVVNLYAMKEYNVKSSWVKLFEISFVSPGEILKPLFFLKNGEILVAWAGRYLVAYYPESQQTSQTGIRLPFDGMVLVPYTDSLISPTCGEDWRGNQQFMNFMADNVAVLDMGSLNLPDRV